MNGVCHITVDDMHVRVVIRKLTRTGNGDYSNALFNWKLKMKSLLRHKQRDFVTNEMKNKMTL